MGSDLVVVFAVIIWREDYRGGRNAVTHTCRSNTIYLRDGRFEMDNNLVENDVRPSAVGRRRWLFIGHPDAGWRSAVIYTIIQSCRRRDINPQEYLTDGLRRLPSMNAAEVKELTPSRWKPVQPAATP